MAHILFRFVPFWISAVLVWFLTALASNLNSPGTILEQMLERVQQCVAQSLLRWTEITFVVHLSRNRLALCVMDSH